MLNGTQSHANTQGGLISIRYIVGHIYYGIYYGLRGGERGYWQHFAAMAEGVCRRKKK
jgi:hypothetical protein